MLRSGYFNDASEMVLITGVKMTLWSPAARGRQVNAVSSEVSDLVRRRFILTISVFLPLVISL